MHTLGEILGNDVNALANIQAKWSDAQEPERERKGLKVTAQVCQGRGCSKQLSTFAALENNPTLLGPNIQITHDRELNSGHMLKNGVALWPCCRLDMSVDFRNRRQSDVGVLAKEQLENSKTKNIWSAVVPESRHHGGEHGVRRPRLRISTLVFLFDSNWIAQVYFQGEVMGQDKNQVSF